jgi:hypothetical protein
MNRRERENLLRDVLSDDSLESLRGRVLSEGIGVLRRRKQRQLLMAAVGGSIAMGALVVVALYRPTNFTIPADPTEPVPALKFINDQQLFALFPNRPSALVGPPGQQQFLFLDGPPGN